MIRQRAFTQPGGIAVARLLNGLFFLTVAAFGFLSCSPFAYVEFIEPNVASALTAFVVVSLFWVALVVTLLTLATQFGGGRGKWIAIAYLVVGASVGVLLVISMPRLTVGNSWRGLFVGLVASTPPVWLAILDHVAQPAPVTRAADRGRVLAACAWSALAVWAMYSLAVPVRLRHAAGLGLSASQLGAALGASLVFDLFVFMALFLALAAVTSAAAYARRRSSVEYWSLVTLLGAGIALVLYFLVCASIAFVGAEAAVASAALGLALTALWSDVARLRLQRPSTRSLDAVDVFSAPIAGGQSRRAAAGLLIVLPLFAYGLVAAVTRFDWSMLLQKLGVLLVWLATFAAVYSAIPESRREPRRPWLAAGLPLFVFALYHAVGWLNPHVEIDRFAVVDPSIRLIRDARTGRSVETADYYRYLRSNTLLPQSQTAPMDIDFVAPLHPATGRTPSIFLFIVDSMRADYLSPYNPQVTFTPHIARLAAESFVFERAFTRYAGTSFAVPSIWAGGMMLHTIGQSAFGRRDTLQKLLDVNGYLRVMTIDSIIDGLVPRGPSLLQLEQGKRTMQLDLCSTVDELQAKLPASRSRPIFFYSLSQNLHISVAWDRKLPAGESYPGFFAPVASGVRRVDACFGRFIDFLKRTGRYDDSIVILLSDHGDSLGEEGRWGHAYFIVPEIMRIPLIVHLPSWMRARVSADLGAPAFSTDITPSLYALLGYEPANLGPLFGRTLFVDPDADVSWRSRQPFLLASSYGPVYATLRHNGRGLSVVDAVDGRDSLFDLGARFVGERLEMTQAMIASNRELIGRQLDALASTYHHSLSR